MDTDSPGTTKDEVRPDPSVRGLGGRRDTSESHPKPYEGSCLRPLGLCELGGCCDLCIHNPDEQ